MKCHKKTETWQNRAHKQNTRTGERLSNVDKPKEKEKGEGRMHSDGEKESKRA